MSDLRPEESDVSERSELPPDLLSLHDRLMGDGARWRWRAPDGDRLARWTRAMLADEEDAATDDLRTRRLERLETDPMDTIPSHVPKGPMRDMTRIRLTRLRGFIGAAAAIVVVGLIALLLTRGLATRGTGGDGDSTLNPTSTIPPTPEPTGTPQNPQNTPPLQPGQLPVVAQSDSSIVYKIANGALLRSSDGGASYTTEALPATDLSQVNSYSIAVSPLDATHVFVTVSGWKNGQGCIPTQPYPATAVHGGVLASGYSDCSEQYISVTSGGAWTRLSLPLQGVIGSTFAFSASQSPYGAQSYIFQAQGQRLYAALGFASYGGSLMGSPGLRLVASDDGGATWRLIDAQVASASQIICDFAAAPDSSTVYAVVEGSCDPLAQATMALWSSADGGRSWTRVGDLPAQARGDITVGAHGYLYSETPTNTQSAPMAVSVSVDGGKTFTTAPSAGPPNSPLLVGPYATLANGAVVYAMKQGDDPNASLYTWCPGAASWTKLGASAPAGIAAVTAEPASSGATQQTLVVIDDDGNSSLVQAPLGQ